MFELTLAHLVAVSTLLFCGICALMLTSMLRHFDPPEAREAPEQPRYPEQPQYKIAV